jgi:predicted transposase YdaD
LQGTDEVRLVLSVLKAAMERRLLEWLDWGEPLLRLIESREFLQALFLYATNAESDLNLREFVARLQSAKIPRAAETIMSIAERIRIEARKEGEQRGEQRGEQKGLERGTLIGEIRALQRVLKRPASAPENLATIEAGQLRAMIADLERELP